MVSNEDFSIFADNLNFIADFNYDGLTASECEKVNSLSRMLQEDSNWHDWLTEYDCKLIRNLKYKVDKGAKAGKQN